MATAAQLKALLLSHGVGDEERFYAIALQVAAAEARSGHTALAKELRDLVEKTRARKGEFKAVTNIAHVAQP